MSRPVALTIAGSDPSGGAGVQADLKTFHQFGVYGMAAITVLTVQNTQGVRSVDPLDPAYVSRQLDALIGDIQPHAVKTGAMGDAGVIAAVADWSQRTRAKLVVDPVMISKNGSALLPDDARGALVRLLLPRALVVTPNLHEAEALTGIEIRNAAHMRMAAEQIRAIGPEAVLIKGGHLPDADQAIDLLRDADGEHAFTSERIETRHTHGTGCTFSAAIAAGLANQLTLYTAVLQAKRYISKAIATAPGLGRGSGPVNHHAE